MMVQGSRFKVQGSRFKKILVLLIFVKRIRREGFGSSFGYIAKNRFKPNLMPVCGERRET
jgi:hypothetical protein